MSGYRRTGFQDYQALTPRGLGKFIVIASILVGLQLIAFRLDGKWWFDLALGVFWLLSWLSLLASSVRNFRSQTYEDEYQQAPRYAQRYFQAIPPRIIAAISISLSLLFVAGALFNLNSIFQGT